MKIAVIGSGYVGLVSGLCFAKINHDVFAVDNNPEKIRQLQSGSIPIYEPGLKEILDEAVTKKKISFTTNLAEAVKQAQAIFIAVGTPQQDDGAAELSFVYEVAEQIAENINGYKVIVTKSTVPVGTGSEVKKIIKEANPGADFSIASNPEFLREGCAIDDFLKPDRIVIGVEDDRAQKIMAEIYQYFADFPIVYTDIATAELIKYAANSFLATKVAFINEMADLCEKVDGNIKKLSLALGLDSRIGNKFLNPGPGFGGSCFPKDILAINNISQRHSVKLSLIEAAISSNQNRKIRMADKIVAAANDDVNGKTIAVLGLAFKANTDDIRYSPSLAIIKELIKKGAKIRAYDQEAINNTQKELGEVAQISYHQSLYEAVEGADVVVIATEWDEFRNLDLSKIKSLQKGNVIVDLRNMLDKDAAKKAGFKYVFVGGN